MRISERATNVLAAIWTLGGLVILGAAVVEHIELLRRPEPFQLSDGAEQSVLIFEAIGLLAVLEGGLRAKRLNQWFWPRRVLTVLILLNSAIWLLFGGPAYEPWFFSSAIALLLIAAIWSVSIPRAKVVT